MSTSSSNSQCGNFIQIFGEIIFFWNLETLNFDFYESLHFLKAEIDQIHKKHSEPQNWRNWQF